MTLIEELVKATYGITAPRSFEDIIQCMPSVHGSAAQMMAVYRTFQKAIDERYITKVENEKNSRKFVGHSYCSTGKAYVKPKRTRQPPLDPI